MKKKEEMKDKEMKKEETKVMKEVEMK